VVRHILSNISRYTGPIFIIFSPYESTLRADYGSLPYLYVRINSSDDQATSDINLVGF